MELHLHTVQNDASVSLVCFEGQGTARSIVVSKNVKESLAWVSGLPAIHMRRIGRRKGNDTEAKLAAR